MADEDELQSYFVKRIERFVVGKGRRIIGWTEIVEGGLAPDEAFLVAVKRMGSLDALSREFANEYSERLWKQLVLLPGGGEAASARAGVTAVLLAVAAGVAMTSFHKASRVSTPPSSATTPP